MGETISVRDLPEDVWHCLILPHLSIPATIQLSEVSKWFHHIVSEYSPCTVYEPRSFRLRQSSEATGQARFRNRIEWLTTSIQQIHSFWPKMKFGVILELNVSHRLPEMADVYDSLKNLHALQVFHDEEITSATPFAQLEEVSLVYCNSLVDVSALHQLRVVKLWRCEAVEDVSALGSVPNLTLYALPHVTDVSNLGSVRNLGLSECSGITDFSALGEHERLNLSCTKIRDVQHLGNVRFLNLSDCKELQFVGAMPGVHTLNLTNTRITNVDHLSNIHTLDLSGCCHLTDISSLRGVDTLLLFDMRITISAGLESHIRHIRW